jgi:hypothetical protein
MKNMAGSLICFLLVINVPFCVSKESNRERLLIDLDWKFSQTETTGAANTKCDESKWRTLNLPHDLWSA